MRSVTPSSTLLIRCYALYHTSFVVGCCILVAHRNYSPLELTGIILTVGFLGGAALNVSHELCHRPGAIDGALATILLCSVSYPTFKLEHVGHHHKWAATPLDPSSADWNTSLYKHLPKAIVKNVINAAKVGYRRSRSLGLRNEFTRVISLLAIFYLAVAILLGPVAVLFLFGQSLVAICWLENANYFQHYGLRRTQEGTGWEPVAERHSWDVDQPLLNTLWLNLPAHAHHHAQPAVSFDQLRLSADSPKYPVGYVCCTFLAMVPPLWNRFARSLIPTSVEDRP